MPIVPNRIDSPYGDILSAFVERLRGEIGLDESVCFLAEDPTVKPPNPGDFFYIVTPDPVLNFIEGNLVGGGRSQLSVATQVFITVTSTQQLDEPGHSTAKMLNPSLGLLPRMTALLTALAIKELTNADGSKLLNQPMHPKNIILNDDGGRETSSVQLILDIEFDWAVDG